MVKQKKEHKSPDEIYASIEVDKSSSKPLSFRADSEVYKRIKTLETVRKENTSLVLKNAVESSFNHMIFSSINNRLYLILKGIFDGINVSSTTLTLAGEEKEKGEKYPFVENSNEFRCKSIVDYHINYPEYEDQNKSLYSLDILQVRISTEGSNSLNLKVTLGNVIDGKSNLINPELYLKIAQIVGKTDFKTEMIPSKKDYISTDISFERGVSFEFDKWNKKFEEELKKFKQMMDEINKLFSQNKNLKKRPDKN